MNIKIYSLINIKIFDRLKFNYRKVNRIYDNKFNLFDIKLKKYGVLDENFNLIIDFELNNSNSFYSNKRYVYNNIMDTDNYSMIFDECGNLLNKINDIFLLPYYEYYETTGKNFKTNKFLILDYQGNIINDMDEYFDI